MHCVICGGAADSPVQMRLALPTETYWHWLGRHFRSFVCGPFVRPNANRTGMPLCRGCVNRIAIQPREDD